MTVFRHELRQGRGSLALWTACVGFLLAVCVFLFPEMKGQMDAIGHVFASMGAFTEAFGMDRLNFGTLTGYYAVECGNVLGLGGAFYAAICASGILCKEEKEKTAEFLLTHPISRRKIVFEKLLAVASQIACMNLAVYALSVSAMAFVGEIIPWKEVSLMHFACLLTQLELAAICFGISAFLRRGSAAVGLGIAVIFYFLNLMGNLTDGAAFLKYITPFGYSDGAETVQNGYLHGNRLLAGAFRGSIGIMVGFLKYTRKDIR